MSPEEDQKIPVATEKRGRQRYGKETLDRVLLAARNEFCSKGLSGGQIESIARSARVSKQFVYHNFGSKISLYEEVIHHDTSRCYSELIDIDYISMSSYRAVETFFGTIIDFYIDMPFLVQLSLDVNFQKLPTLRTGKIRRGVENIFEGIVDRAIARGEMPANTDRRACFTFAMMMICGSFLSHERAWGYGDPALDPTERAKRQKATVLNAIAAVMALRGDEWERREPRPPRLLVAVNG